MRMMEFTVLNKLSISALVGVLMLAIPAFGMTSLKYTGKITRVENGRAIMKTAKGDVKIKLKLLNKKDRALVTRSMASNGKPVTLFVTPAHLAR